MGKKKTRSRRRLETSRTYGIRLPLEVLQDEKLIPYEKMIELDYVLSQKFIMNRSTNQQLTITQLITTILEAGLESMDLSIYHGPKGYPGINQEFSQPAPRQLATKPPVAETPKTPVATKASPQLAKLSLKKGPTDYSKIGNTPQPPRPPVPPQQPKPQEPPRPQAPPSETPISQPPVVPFNTIKPPQENTPIKRKSIEDAENLGTDEDILI